MLKYCSEQQCSLLKAQNQGNPDPTFPAPPAPNILVKVNEMWEPTGHLSKSFCFPHEKDWYLSAKNHLLQTWWEWWVGVFCSLEQAVSLTVVSCDTVFRFPSFKAPSYQEGYQPEPALICPLAGWLWEWHSQEGSLPCPVTPPALPQGETARFKQIPQLSFFEWEQWWREF